MEFMRLNLSECFFFQLELVFVWFLKVVVKRLVGGKWGACAGQACIGIDYLLVQHKSAPHLVLKPKICYFS